MPIIETDLMRRTVKRTLAVHPESALIVWTGVTRLGKTTTARWLVQAIEEAYAPEVEGAFRAVHYEVGRIPQWFSDAGKRALRSAYHASIGTLDEGLFRRSPSEDLARLLTRGLQRKHVQMLLVDEAGLLPMEAIRGLVLLRDVALLEGHCLSIVLIGMDDLPVLLGTCPQVKGRILEWCYFAPYNLRETWDLLAALHPHFASLDRKRPDHKAQVDFLHKTYGGVPGLLVPFLRKLDSRLSTLQGEVDLQLLMAIHLLTQRDHERAVRSKGGDEQEEAAREVQTPTKRGRRK
ncbi:MAG TPA: ATP-binding protein [Longimicrobiaceae bacterium]|nr:ATP-binding protein [Longimicrobiaceae bacterium]